eukprot:473482-Amphidinium_carterae.1
MCASALSVVECPPLGQPEYSIMSGLELWAGDFRFALLFIHVSWDLARQLSNGEQGKAPEGLQIHPTAVGAMVHLAHVFDRRNT